MPVVRFFARLCAPTRHSNSTPRSISSFGPLPISFMTSGRSGRNDSGGRCIGVAGGGSLSGLEERIDLSVPPHRLQRRA
jgi:hypothetical protein